MPRIQNNVRDRRSFLKLLAVAGAGAALRPNAHPADLEVDASTQTVPKRKFGRHDEMVSTLGLGGHTLATVKTVEEATKIAHAAIDAGVTFFDNAWEYHQGRGEEWMGLAVKGKRDRVFLMTKVCTHKKGQATKQKAMAMLEQSLKRLQTDRLDLWQIHAIGSEAEADSVFSPNGVLDAIEDAKKQGKIRYCGFTGHLNPQMHMRVLAHRYPFDAVQMPLSVCDAHSGGFQKLVLPELLKQGIAPLAMKSLGGSAKMVKDGLVTADEALRYTLTLPITTLISGINTLEWLNQNARVAAKLKPYTPEEMKSLEDRCSSKREYEPYREWAYLDGGTRFSAHA